MCCLQESHLFVACVCNVLHRGTLFRVCHLFCFSAALLFVVFSIFKA